MPNLSIFYNLCFFWCLSIYLFIFIYGCAGSPPPREGSLQPRQAGATPHRGARAPHHCGLSCCGAQAPDAHAQQSWPTGPAALRHVGSSQARARTRVPCTGRQTLNHCATREALYSIFLKCVEKRWHGISTLIVILFEVCDYWVIFFYILYFQMSLDDYILLL